MNFSVIIPLYNKAPYVEKAIYSVLTQTYQEFELIVVNDGSTDSSLEKVQEFKNSQIQIVSQENSGVSIARNNGVKIARGKYITFLDADDWWAPTFLEEMKALIEEFPDAGIYGSSYYIVKNGKERIAPIGVDEAFTQGKINYYSVYAKTLCMPLWTGAVCIPRTVFDEQNGFKPQLKLGEDFDLWVRIAIKYAVVLLNKPLAYYNQDVEQELRGVVFEKIYPPETHFIFNLDYLLEYENPDLKKMLDSIRIYTLFRYRLQNKYIEEYRKEMNKVDFNGQPCSTYLQYKLPIGLLKCYYTIRRTIISLIK